MCRLVALTGVGTRVLLEMGLVTRFLLVCFEVRWEGLAGWVEFDLLGLLGDGFLKD